MGTHSLGAGEGGLKMIKRVCHIFTFTAALAAAAQISLAVLPAQRLIVEVAPVDIGSRESDEMPAKIELNWPGVLADAKLQGKVDFDSIRITQIDSSGNALPFGKGADGKPIDSRPFRWYDSDIPDPFLEFH